MTAAAESAGSIARCLLYLNTLRYVSWAQIFWRLWRRTVRATPRAFRGAKTANTPDFWIESIAKASEWRGAQRWHCHGRDWEILPDQPWAPAGMSDLDAYHLHYLDELASRAVRLEPAVGAPLVLRWLRDNRAAPPSAFRPYPVSRRLLNLCKWRLSGGEWTQQIIDSVASQGELLNRTLEFDVRGNHLIANAVALLFVGTLLSGASASKWRRRGATLLRQELDRQILADGGHYERSPVYHACVLEDLLDAINLRRTECSDDARTTVACAERMLAWLIAMTMPDGQVAQFNDAALNGGPSTADLTNYASRLGLRTDMCDRSRGVNVLEQSGFVSARMGRWTAIVDIGQIGPDEQAGHAHADTLSFLLACDDTALVVDPGTSTYEAGALRGRERGTASHNTVVVDGLDSSEVWGQFRTARRANVDRRSVVRADERISVTGRHDGFRRLRDPVWHTRTWLIGASQVEVVDQIEGIGCHDVSLGLLLSNAVSVSAIDARTFLIRARGIRVRVSMPEQLGANLLDEKWGRGFGEVVSVKRLCASAFCQLPLTLRTSLVLEAND